MTRPLRIGLIGASRIAASAIIAPAQVVSGVEVAAVAARDRSRGAAFARQFDIATTHGSYEAVIDDPNVELVYIATPPSLHAPLTLRAINAGKAADQLGQGSGRDSESGAARVCGCLKRCTRCIILPLRICGRCSVVRRSAALSG